MKTFNDALYPLTVLNTIEEVAEFLREKDIKGVRLSAGSCPIAKYMEIETGLIVSVGSFDVGGWSKTYEETFHSDLLSPVSDFVRYFDRGGFPELEKGRANLTGGGPK